MTVLEPKSGDQYPEMGAASSEYAVMEKGFKNTELNFKHGKSIYSELYTTRSKALSSQIEKVRSNV